MQKPFVQALSDKLGDRSASDLIKSDISIDDGPMMDIHPCSSPRPSGDHALALSVLFKSQPGQQIEDRLKGEHLRLG